MGGSGPPRCSGRPGLTGPVYRSVTRAESCWVTEPAGQGRADSAVTGAGRGLTAGLMSGCLVAPHSQTAQGWLEAGQGQALGKQGRWQWPVSSHQALQLRGSFSPGMGVGGEALGATGSDHAASEGLELRPGPPSLQPPGALDLGVPGDDGGMMGVPGGGFQGDALSSALEGLLVLPGQVQFLQVLPGHPGGPLPARRLLLV